MKICEILRETSIPELVAQEREDILDDHEEYEESTDKRNPLKLKNNGNTYLYNGVLCWSGAFDVLDGEIVAAYSYATAYNADFHHSFYFAPHIAEGMEEGKYQFFWVQNGKLNTEWREAAAQPAIINRILEQIQVL